MFDFFRPAQITDVNQTVNTFFNFNKYTKIGKVANCCFMFGTQTKFGFNIFPWISFQLFDTQRHFSFITVKG